MLHWISPARCGLMTPRWSCASENTYTPSLFSSSSARRTPFRLISPYPSRRFSQPSSRGSASSSPQGFLSSPRLYHCASLVGMSWTDHELCDSWCVSPSPLFFSPLHSSPVFHLSSPSRSHIKNSLQGINPGDGLLLKVAVGFEAALGLEPSYEMPIYRRPPPPLTQHPRSGAQKGGASNIGSKNSASAKDQQPPRAHAKALPPVPGEEVNIWEESPSSDHVVYPHLSLNLPLSFFLNSPAPPLPSSCSSI